MAAAASRMNVKQNLPWAGGGTYPDRPAEPHVCSSKLGRIQALSHPGEMGSNVFRNPTAPDARDWRASLRLFFVPVASYPVFSLPARLGFRHTKVPRP